VGVCEQQGGNIWVLANEWSMYRPPAGQGILPRAAADHHSENFLPVLLRALSSSGVKLSEVDLFSFSKGPGIGQCLRVSCAGAKYLASKYKKALVGVNHCAAHLEISRGLLSMRDPLYVYVSGANTQLIVKSRAAKKGTPRYAVLGETLDIGLGNLFDVFAREAGFARPHGSEVARLANDGKYFPLPYTVKGMNFAFAGLLTSAVREVGRRKTADICHSLMETSFAELCEAAERALCLTGKKEVAVCGGVAQNQRFCEMLSIVCKEHGARFGVVAPEYNADNGAMIAYAGILERARAKRENISALAPNGYWRIDEVM
jgi:glycoprotease/Kae1 family metallohydrolase